MSVNESPNATATGNHHCAVCDRYFSTRPKLVRHWSTLVHNFENGRQCDVCKKTLSRQWIARHCRRVHNMEWPGLAMRKGDSQQKHGNSTQHTDRREASPATSSSLTLLNHNDLPPHQKSSNGFVEQTADRRADITSHAPEPKQGVRVMRTFTNQDLPFDRESATEQAERWSSVFMTNVYNWAASIENPWRAYSHPEFYTVIKSTWILVFPDLADEADHPSIHYLASRGIRCWRGRFGLNVLSVVDKMFHGKDSSEVLEAMKEYLPPPRFLCKNPNATDGSKDEWLSDLFIKTFVWHLRYMFKAEIKPVGYPIGAAALTATAIERALNAWKTGSRSVSPEKFAKGHWRGVTRSYAQSASQLSDVKWATIIEAAKQANKSHLYPF